MSEEYDSENAYNVIHECMECVWSGWGKYLENGRCPCCGEICLPVEDVEEIDPLLFS